MPEYSNQLIVLPSAPETFNPTRRRTRRDCACDCAAQENLLGQQKANGHSCRIPHQSHMFSDFPRVVCTGAAESTRNCSAVCVRHLLKRRLPEGGWNVSRGRARRQAGEGLFRAETYRIPWMPPLSGSHRNHHAPWRHPTDEHVRQAYLALLIFPWKSCRRSRWRWCSCQAGRHFTCPKCRRGVAQCSCTVHYQPFQTRPVVPGEKQLRGSPVWAPSEPIADCRAARSSGRGAIFSSASTNVGSLQPPSWNLRLRALEAAEHWSVERIGEGSDGARRGLSRDV